MLSTRYTLRLCVCVCVSLGSLATVDAFTEAYVTKGLNRDAMCPCSGSPEALTLSLRRYVITSVTMTMQLCC